MRRVDTAASTRNTPRRPAARSTRLARAISLALLALAALAPSGTLAGNEHFFAFNAPADPAAPRISALGVAPVGRLAPGAALRFELRGTPGAQATLRIDGARRTLGLVEVSPGQYQGVYTVGLDDRIAPDASVLGNLRRGEQLGLALLTEPLQRDTFSARAPV